MEDKNILPVDDIREHLKENFVSGLPKTLNEGDIVDIWIERDDGTEYLECTAELSKKLTPVVPKEPYVYITLGDKDSINAVKEKWEVLPICETAFDDCKPRVRWVRKFFSFGIIPLKDIETLSGFDSEQHLCR